MTSDGRSLWRKCGSGNMSEFSRRRRDGGGGGRERLVNCMPSCLKLLIEFFVFVLS